jgi:Concanavalin A-like lectin/glucanases superfamily
MKIAIRTFVIVLLVLFGSLETLAQDSAVRVNVVPAASFITDAATNNVIGTLSGPVDAEWEPVFGGDLWIQDATGFVQLDHSPALQPAHGTVSVWIKTDVNQDADVVVDYTDQLLRSGVSGGFAVYRISITHTGRAVAEISNDDTTLRPLNTYWTIIESPTHVITTGQWHLITSRWDGQVLSLFVDGQLQAATAYKEVPVVGLSYNGDYPVLLASGTMWHTPGAHEFVGRIARLQIFGAPISDSEISSEFEQYKH